MNDKTTSLDELKKLVQEFVAERNWHTHHDPKNLSMALAVEAAELMEHFIWVKSSDAMQQINDQRSDIEDELADVIIAAIAFANVSDINVVHAIERKMKKIKEKYPIEKVKDQSAAEIRKIKQAYKK